MQQIDIARHYDGEILESGAATWRRLEGGDEFFEFSAPVYELTFNDKYNNDRWLVKSIHVHKDGVNASLWMPPEHQTGEWQDDQYAPLFPLMEDVALRPMWPMPGEIRVWNQ